jgi:hypothetical protein
MVADPEVLPLLGVMALARHNPRGDEGGEAPNLAAATAGSDVQQEEDFMQP